jgi:magnesium transporter
MAHKRKSGRKRKIGLSPGTIEILSSGVGEIKLELFVYHETDCTLKRIKEDALLQLKPEQYPNHKIWLNVDGIHNPKLIEAVGRNFNIHSLALEDIATPDQRPKFDQFDKNVYAVIKMLNYDEQSETIQSEQISLVLGEKYVITFGEKEGDVFDPNRERLKQGKGRLRKSGSDYLFYTLIDTIVDNYFLILEKLGEKIEILEDELINNPGPENLKVLYKLKREMILLRKNIWPLREMLNKMIREESQLVSHEIQIYWRDVYDHTIQIIDTIEMHRDMLASMLDIYLSGISNKMNAVMKVLTVISTIFIPLTFIAGIYGMNFKYMPELQYRNGYFWVLGVCAALALVMLGYFRKKKWL